MHLLEIESFDPTTKRQPPMIRKEDTPEARDGRSPPYAILSHRWETEEVLFGDVVQNNATTKYGQQKVIDTILKAQRDGHKYLWIDSCCIDKDSSAELSEAINSMYQWYSTLR